MCTCVCVCVCVCVNFMVFYYETDTETYCMYTVDNTFVVMKRQITKILKLQRHCGLHKQRNQIDCNKNMLSTPLSRRNSLSTRDLCVTSFVGIERSAATTRIRHSAFRSEKFTVLQCSLRSGNGWVHGDYMKNLVRDKDS